MADTFRWRGLTFTTVSESDLDNWFSRPGHWSVARTLVQDPKTLTHSELWTATWSYKDVTWNATDPTRPFDRLAALDALFDKAKEQSAGYYRELGDAWQAVRSLERDLVANRRLKDEILEVEKLNAHSAR